MSQDPEHALIRKEEREAEDAEVRRERMARQADRRALTDHYVRYARKHGWPEAKGWAAARAHHDPSSGKAADAARAEADKHFKVRAS